MKTYIWFGDKGFAGVVIVANSLQNARLLATVEEVDESSRIYSDDPDVVLNCTSTSIPRVDVYLNETLG